jgi:hypothetical protein
MRRDRICSLAGREEDQGRYARDGGIQRAGLVGQSRWLGYLICGGGLACIGAAKHYCVDRGRREEQLTSRGSCWTSERVALLSRSAVHPGGR